MSLFSCVFLFIVLTECFTQSVLAKGPAPAAILYSERGGKGRTLKAFAENHRDLSQVDFDDTAQTACIRGTWLFYEAKNFGDPNGIIGYRFSKEGRSYCFNFESLAGRLSSFRFVGSEQDCTADSLDLYNGPHFTDEHLSTQKNIANLKQSNVNDPQSLIISGKTVWTLYEEPNFAGNYVCVASNREENTPRFISIATDLGKLKAIASVKAGCIATEK